MKKLNIIYTMEIQDGENRYKLHSPQTIEIDTEKDQLTQINDFGEELAQEYYGNTSKERDNGDWYEVDNGCRAIRYKSFDIIDNEETFEQIQFILYK